MPMLADALRYQIEFTTWATTRTLQAAAALSSSELAQDFGTADKSVFGTLLHIYRSERMWLARIEGRPQAFAMDSEKELSQLLEDWPKVRNAWHSWAASLSDSNSVQTLTYQDLRGNTWTNEIWEIVLHVVNHSTHHRGQVSGFLRSLGKTPPNLDSIGYARTAKPPALRDISSRPG